MQLQYKILLFSLLIFLFNLSLRLVFLGSHPPVISHDEIYYVTEAKALASWGSDTSDQWSPLTLTAANPLYAELPGVLMTPAAMLFPNDPILAAKLTHAVIGSLLPIILGLVAASLFNSRATFWVVVGLASVNPWLFQFSRMGFDALFSLFFYFLGTLLLTRRNKTAKILSLVFFTLGFFQYQGLKLVFLPFVWSSCVLSWWNDKSYEKKTIKSLIFSVYGVILLASLIVMLVYLLRLSQQSAGGRVNDLIFTKKSYITALVNSDRQIGLEHSTSKFFTNKATVVMRQFWKNYISTLDLSQLFVSTEPVRNPFAVRNVGMFYLFDLALMAIGALHLIQKRTLWPAATWLLLLFLVAPLPSAINATGTWITFRASLLIPVGILLTGLGFTHLWKKLNAPLKTALCCLYLTGTVIFLQEYFIRLPVYGTDGEYFAERIITGYTQRSPNEIPITILTDESKFVFESILAYSNAIKKANYDEITSAFQSKNYQFSNFRVTSDCVSQEMLDQGIVIAKRTIQPCIGVKLPSEKVVAIPSLIDSGAVYTIYNDSICSRYDLPRFSSVRKNNFNIEKLDVTTFCTTFFSR